MYKGLYMKDYFGWVTPFSGGCEDLPRNPRDILRMCLTLFKGLVYTIARDLS